MTWNQLCNRMARFMKSADREFIRRGLKAPPFTLTDLGDYYHVHGVNATGRGFARFMIDRIEQRKKNKKTTQKQTKKTCQKAKQKGR